MPEHVHLILYPHQSTYDIAEIRRSIKEPVGRLALAYMQTHAPQWIDKVTRRRGKRVERLFWQSGGGYDRNIDQPATLWKMVDYLHANPVRRNLVDRTCDWPWSSARWYDQKIEGVLKIDPMSEAWACS